MCNLGRGLGSISNETEESEERGEFDSGVVCCGGAPFNGPVRGRTILSVEEV